VLIPTRKGRTVPPCGLFSPSSLYGYQMLAQVRTVVQRLSQERHS
jgi:hypothetical protein